MANVTTNNESTNYDRWQEERFGNVIPPIEVTPAGDLFESGIEELNRMAEWINLQADLQMFENY
jgi:hypothetical protein